MRQHALLLLILLPTAAFAEPDHRTVCATSCKVITLNADEEKALVGPNMVLDTAAQARQLDMLGVVNYFRSKIAAAPAGDLPKPAEPPAKPEAPPSK